MSQTNQNVFSNVDIVVMLLLLLDQTELPDYIVKMMIFFSEVPDIFVHERGETRWR